MPRAHFSVVRLREENACVANVVMRANVSSVHSHVRPCIAAAWIGVDAEDPAPISYTSLLLAWKSIAAEKNTTLDPTAKTRQTLGARHACDIDPAAEVAVNARRDRISALKRATGGGSS